MKFRIVDCDACEPVDFGTFNSIQAANDYAHIARLRDWEVWDENDKCVDFHTRQS